MLYRQKSRFDTILLNICTIGIERGKPVVHETSMALEYLLVEFVQFVGQKLLPLLNRTLRPTQIGLYGLLIFNFNVDDAGTVSLFRAVVRPLEQTNEVLVRRIDWLNI